MKNKKNNQHRNDSQKAKNEKGKPAQKTPETMAAGNKSPLNKNGEIMSKKNLSAALIILFGATFFSHLSYAEQKVTTTEETTTQTTTTPRGSKKAPATTTTTSNTSATVTKEAAPKPELDSRTVLNEEMLKKMSNTLCTDGFKAYVGSDKRNICQSRVTAPDIAYSCIWDKRGNAAYAPTPQGPCSLDFTDHKGSIVITKNDFSNPPLPYGTEAQCCYRAAQGYTSN